MMGILLKKIYIKRKDNSQASLKGINTLIKTKMVIIEVAMQFKLTAIKIHRLKFKIKDF